MAKFFELPFEQAYWAIKDFGWWKHYDSGYHRLDIYIEITKERGWDWLSDNYSYDIEILKREHQKNPTKKYKFKASSYDDDYTAKGVKALIKGAKESAKKYNLDGNLK